MNISKKEINEELVNVITHSIGLLLSFLGVIFLVFHAVQSENIWYIVSSIIYGISLIILYTASTLYHISTNPRTKDKYRVFDHSSIYLLIAGTYTPFTLVNLRGSWGWTLFGIIWGLALIGVIGKIFYFHKFEKVSTFFYILMGWVIIVAIEQLFKHVLFGGLLLIFLGGLFYTAGSYFLRDSKIPYSHAIWHIFVLAGSINHYLAVLLYVLPN